MTELLAEVNDERVTARFVRFLIAEGVIPGPSGGRANAAYDAAHVGGIRRYLDLRDCGLSASRVKEILAGVAAGGIPVPIAPGLTLIIDQEKLAGPVLADDVAARIVDAFNLIKPRDD